MKKSNLHYIRGITPKRVTNGGAHLRGLALGQHRSKETWQWWRAVVYTASNSTGPGIELQISAPIAMSLATGRSIFYLKLIILFLMT